LNCRLCTGGLSGGIIRENFIKDDSKCDQKDKNGNVFHPTRFLFGRTTFVVFATAIALSRV